MAVIRDFKETVQARALYDPAFREGLLRECIDNMLAGDTETGKALLRDYINATIGFEELGRVFSGPLDVELSDNNVVQPDVLVVLKQHRDRIRKTHIIGAPDLVIEIASPSTARHDQRAKLDAYASAGVPEYWVIDPDAQTVKLLILKNGVYCSRGVFSGQSGCASFSGRA